VAGDIPQGFMYFTVILKLLRAAQVFLPWTLLKKAPTGSTRNKKKKKRSCSCMNPKASRPCGIPAV
jgi:hypothetical protein